MAPTAQHLALAVAKLSRGPYSSQVSSRFVQGCFDRDSTPPSLLGIPFAHPSHRTWGLDATLHTTVRPPPTHLQPLELHSPGEGNGAPPPLVHPLWLWLWLGLSSRLLSLAIFAGQGPSFHTYKVNSRCPHPGCSGPPTLRTYISRAVPCYLSAYTKQQVRCSRSPIYRIVLREPRHFRPFKPSRSLLAPRAGGTHSCYRNVSQPAASKGNSSSCAPHCLLSVVICE